MGRWPWPPGSGQATQGGRCGWSQARTWRTARSECPSLQSQPLRSPEISCSVIIVPAELDNSREHPCPDETHGQVYLTGGVARFLAERDAVRLVLALLSVRQMRHQRGVTVDLHLEGFEVLDRLLRGLDELLRAGRAGHVPLNGVPADIVAHSPDLEVLGVSGVPAVEEFVPVRGVVSFVRSEEHTSELQS